MKTTLTFMLAIIAAALLSFVGPELDAQSAAANTAVNDAGQRERALIAAKEICGPNSAFELEGNTLQCFNQVDSTVTARIEQ